MKRNFGFRFLACVAVLLCCTMPLGMSAFAEGAEDKETALLSWYRENVDSAAESENFSCVSMACVGETEFYRVSLKEDVFIPEETYVRLGEAVLQLPNSAPCVVYASGKVYTLVEAYTAGVLNGEILTRENFADSVLDVFGVGDLDFDGKCSVSDVVLLRQFIVTGDGDITLMDIDGDGALTVSDVVGLREKIIAS